MTTRESEFEIDADFFDLPSSSSTPTNDSWIAPKPSAASTLQTSTEWSSLYISRPLVKCLLDLDHLYPTSIQEKVVPQALKGRDIIACAETGSGKTAAFLIPACERLLRSPAVASRRRTPHGLRGGFAVTKGLVLTPTRELARQCHAMLSAFAARTPITFAVVTGGQSLADQRRDLSARPDIIVATPGRVLDHVLNSPNAEIDSLEILILDEADKLLEFGFKKECFALLERCSPSRQIMLFSATLTEGVRELSEVLGLRNPSGFHISKDISGMEMRHYVVGENQRDPGLLYLLQNEFSFKTIVFFTKKTTVRRMCTICKHLLGIKAVQFHGDLNQDKRDKHLSAFARGEATHLFASDLAGRGLDLPDVKGVINFDVPLEGKRYIHRAGRTARMGTSGLVATIITEDEKLIAKKQMPKTKKFVPTRLDGKKLDEWNERIAASKGKIKHLLQLERSELELEKAEKAIEKYEKGDVMPTRWIQSTKDRKVAKREARARFHHNTKRVRTQ